MTTVKLAGHRRRITPKDSAVVVCKYHGITTTWGALDAIQRIAVAEGIDTGPDMVCLLSPRRKALKKATPEQPERKP